MAQNDSVIRSAKHGNMQESYERENQQTAGTEKDTNGIVFLSDMEGEDCIRALSYLGGPKCTVVRDLKTLTAAQGQILLSFSTSVIVPPSIISRFTGGAYNIHAASPEYPGRDPHHWAVYEQATRYGATAHIMTAKVDDGPIVAVERFDVKPGVTPVALLAQANEAGFRLLERLGLLLQRHERPKPIARERWGSTKRSRADFLAMCRIDPAISREEFERRFHAFDGGNYDNLTLELHERIFRIEKKVSN